MGSQHFNNVLTHSQHKGSALFVLATIAVYTDDDRPVASLTTTKKELENTCRLGHRGLDKVLAKLRASGELETHYNPDTQQHQFVIPPLPVKVRVVR